MSHLATNRPPSFMSRKELAWELSVSESTVDELVRRGVIPKYATRRRGEPLWRWVEVERRIQRLPKVGTIYVVGFDNYVKIGITFTSPSHRMAGIQTGCPRKLQLYAELEGTVPDERDLHRRFKAHAANGEWFVREGGIAAWIEGGCK